LPALQQHSNIVWYRSNYLDKVTLVFIKVKTVENKKTVLKCSGKKGFWQLTLFPVILNAVIVSVEYTYEENWSLKNTRCFALVFS
jgi:hypothetical protein